jgi:WhiB family transcriptional regulator, redox-sensing transcriptional regulator
MKTQMTASKANWRLDAACCDVDPDLFFPIGAAGPALLQIQQAKQICLTCPVRTLCLAWALDHKVADGVWGGTTDDERHAIRRRHQRANHGGMMTRNVRRLPRRSS